MTGNPGHGPDEREGDLGSNGHGSSDTRSQRERLIEAFTKVAADRGYAGTSVEEVASLAEVPPDVFETHFSSKRQCLSAAYDAFFMRLIEETKDSVDEDHEWPLQVKEAVAASLEFVSETASRARFFAVDALGAGPLILERYMAAIETAVALLRAGREHYPEAVDLPSSTESVLIGGIACLVSSVLLEEEHETLSSLEAELVEILLTPYVGSAEARRISS